MQSFSLVAVTGLLFYLAPASTLAQELHCIPCSYGFGGVQIGTPTTYSIQLSNHGTKTLRISSKSKQGSAFSFGAFPLPVKILPGSTIQLPLIFTPTARGYSTGVFTLVSNDPTSPRSIKVHGHGFYPHTLELGISPATLSFGNVTVGSSASLQATLTASNAAVTISSDQSMSSEFAILGLNLPVAIPAGQSIAVTVQFTPNASGTALAKVGFISNAINSPTVGQLTGTGVAQSSHNVFLSWDAGSGTPVGYNVFRGTAKAGPFAQINSALDSSTDYTDYTVVSGTTYYYVATAVDDQGEESAYSSAVHAVIP